MIIGVIVGAVLIAGAVAYEWYVTAVLGLMVANLYVVAVGLLPGAPGLYAIVAGVYRAYLLGKIERRPDSIEMVELDSRFEQLALKVVFRNGETVSFMTGRADREALMRSLLGPAHRDSR